LLLFDTFNENGNNENNGRLNNTAELNHAVNPLNRLYTTLISKDLIILEPNPDQSKFFLLDRRTDILGAIEAMKQRGVITQISPEIPGELDFNNGNGQISPGEVVGIALNLYNDSNSPMGGIQVLANDWDHTKGTTTPRPCNTFEDNFPLDSEGAASPDGAGVPTEGDCGYVSRNNGNQNILLPAEPGENMHPVCFVQVTEDGATKWASQNALREERNLEVSSCLGNSTHDCYFRAIPGGDFAWYSKIEPKQNWGNSVSATGAQPSFTESNAMFFEVNKKTPPGTTFDCRFRVRFSNCKECFNDPLDSIGDDYLDYEYSGDRPFKIIHFQFTVID